MNEIDWRVLATLADSPKTLIRDEEEKLSLSAMALYIDHPVSDVYEMSDGSLIGRVTDAGHRMLKERALRQKP